MHNILVRHAGSWDKPQLLKLSPPEVKNPAEFDAYVTLVAENIPLLGAEYENTDRELLGYCQFSIDPGSRLLTSYSIRIAPHAKGHGIGRLLIRKQREIARAAGAVTHLYVVDPDGENALKKILISEGLSLTTVYSGKL